MDCKRKLNSIKSRDFMVYIGSFDEKSPFVYTSGIVLFVCRNLNVVTHISDFYFVFFINEIIQRVLY